MKNTVFINNKKIPKSEILKWTKALRSGKFKQTKGQLQDESGHCCLGVLCEVTIPKDKRWLDGQILSGDFPYQQPFAPDWVKEINVDFLGKTRRGFVTLNDGENLTFDEIADCIEAVYIHEVLS